MNSDADTVDQSIADLPPVETPLPRQIRKVEVKAFIDPRQLKKDMSYSSADLSAAMMEQASLFVHYAGLAAQASRQVDNMKMVLENAEARVYRAYRDAAAANGTKMSEAALEKSVSVHPQVVALKRALNEAKQIEALAKAAVEGFRHRRDMLIQAGLISREEMKGDVSIARRQSNENAMNDLKERTLARLRNAGDDA